MLLSDERLEKLSEFTKRHNLDFKNFELLNCAFCHTSYTYENGGDRLESYERLEFLGDAVLKLAVSEILYQTYKEKTEGQLSEQRAYIIADRTIANFASKIGFEDLILTGKCETNKGKESILACSFEAFLGAIYLEFKTKGFNVAKKFLADNFIDDILHVDFTNPKAELQELTQSLNKNLPKYVILEEKGPAHSKTFVSGVYYENKLLGKGEAKTKKEAEFEAAREGLVSLKKLCGENDAK